MDQRPETPAEAGFAMPAEWSRHAATLMSWPCRRDLWGDRLEDAKRDYAIVARAIAAFEPVLLACPPGTAADARDRCGSGVETIEVPLDDSWARDNGPIFVRDPAGRVAAVKFGFNAWGDRWHPYDADAAFPERVAAHLGMRLFTAPFVLEGGAILVDGEGTLITTEQCLLNPNRNPTLSRADIERGLRDYLGITTIVWLPVGHVLDTGPAGTDGHVDGIAQVPGPRRLLIEAPSDPRAGAFEGGQANLAALHAARDAHGRPFEVSILDPGADPGVSYANHFIANGAVIVPVTGDDRDGPVLEFLAAIYPDREVIGVPGATLAFGGGGPHCITQQIPEGSPAPI